MNEIQIDPTAERIFAVIKQKEETEYSVAKKLGISHVTFSNWRKKGITPSLDFVRSFVKLYPDTDANWLVTGLTDKGRPSLYPELEPSALMVKYKELESDYKKLEIENAELKQDRTAFRQALIFHRNETLRTGTDDESFNEANEEARWRTLEVEVENGIWKRKMIGFDFPKTRPASLAKEAV